MENRPAVLGRWAPELTSEVNLRILCKAGLTPGVSQFSLDAKGRQQKTERRWHALKSSIPQGRTIGRSVRQGRRGEAHTTLSDIYNWFTEGFDTVDPKDTQAMLDELPARTAEH